MSGVDVQRSTQSEIFPALLIIPLTSLEDIYTALRNHNRIIYYEMSSWTALTRHIGMKTAFYTKHIRANMFGFLL